MTRGPDKESTKALNIRDFPESLREKCRIKALKEPDKTLRNFVIRILREATAGEPEPKPKPKEPKNKLR